MSNSRFRKAVAWLTLSLMTFADISHAATVTLATAPLANATTSVVRPNIMYVLDDSGSMLWDYTPDYVNDDSTSGTYRMCWKSTFGTVRDSNDPAQCTSSKDMPWATSDINYQYYSPTINYTLPRQANGTEYAASLSAPTAAHSNGFDSASGTTNLTSQWSHTVWCDTDSRNPTAADPTAGGFCVENGFAQNNTLYPSASRPYPRTYTTGAPFYYTMAPNEYCADTDGKVCVASTSATTIGGLAYDKPSYYRWCSSYSTTTHTFSGCQNKRDATHYIPNYLGGWWASATAGAKASAALTVKTTFTTGQTITSVTVNGTNILAGGTTITAIGGDTATTIAQRICTAIQANTGISGYGCPTAPTTATLNILANTIGSTPNGYPVVAVGPAGSAGVNSQGTITVTTATAGKQITQIVINGHNLLTSAVTDTGVIGNTAMAICNAIKAGPSNTIYTVRSGGTTTWGSCTSGSGLIEIMRLSQDAVDNGQAITVTGPAPAAGSYASATLTINSTSGPTQVNDVKVGTTSVLTGTLPITFADGTATSTIAATLASAIGNGYTATAAGNVITVTSATLGTNTSPLTLVATGASATATITVSSTGHTYGADLGGISAGGTQFVPHVGPGSLVNGTATTTNAAVIAASVGAGFSASASGSVVTVSAPAGSAYNGVGLTFIAGTSGTTVASKPVWKFNINDATTDYRNIHEVRCGTSGGTRAVVYDSASTGDQSNNTDRVKALASSISATNSYAVSCTSAKPSICTVTGPTTGPTTCANQELFLDASKTIACGAATGGGAVRTWDDSCDIYVKVATDGATGATYENFAPFLAGTTFAGGRSGQLATGSNMSGGSPGTISTTTTAMTNGQVATGAIPTNATGTAPDVLIMSGGQDAVLANSRTGTGIFKRTDIVPTATATTLVDGASVTLGTAPTYTKYPGRVCAGASCTYAEELANFANWYTFYRTRILMMKTTSTQAFHSIQNPERYRIGFDKINDYAGSTTRVPVAQFVDSGGEVANQRTNWWNALTAGTCSTCATPLRASTAKIGRYYAGKLDTTTAHPDPIQYSCQQNFTFLVTDGYWNEAERFAISKVNGSDIANTDNNSTTAPYPFYDGQQASTTCPTRSDSDTRSSASSCRTLADVAWYYYSTDLRHVDFSNTTNVATGQNVSANNVPATPTDANTAQHMTFFAMGLGVDGTLAFRPDYATAGVGDYAEIVAGTRNWPAVKNLDPTGVDDLWHATVNGHGKYFSARNPTSVSAGLIEALNSISARTGSAAAAATSNLEPVAGDNYAYVASYETVDWVGDVQARTINLATGEVSADTNCGVTGSGCTWSAQDLLDLKNWTTRNIYIAPTSGTSGSVPRQFTYANLTGTTASGEKSWFEPNSLSQYPTVFLSNPTDITATKLVDYLSGDRSLEQNGVVGQPQVWRKRVHVLGDIVDSQPIFIKRPKFSYLDAGYSTFKTSGVAATRQSVVYISANDGMLHAFDGDTGTELWSYIPQQTLSVMKTLADASYVHRYFLDGHVVVGDVNFGGGDSDWHTILVAGMGGGGTGYFALDITDPTSPKYLWEVNASTTGFANLGLTYGNPLISKLPNGEWTVFFTSGYNNADGVGYLYGLNPQTGAIKTGFPLSTASGTSASPSNLGKMSAWVTDPAQNNTALFIYAGDLNGDLWRFDTAPGTALHSSTAVFKLAHLANGSGQAQPITTKPEMAEVDSEKVIYVGTGQYLGIPDLSNTQVQSFYAIRDTIGAPNLGGVAQETWNPRTDQVTILGTPVNQFLQRKLIGYFDDGTQITETVGGVTYESRQMCTGASSTVSATATSGVHLCLNESTPTTVDWTTQGGWFVDFPDAGERMNVDMNLSLGTLTFATNVPTSTACVPDGYGWLNYIDYRTGLAVPNTTENVSRKVGNALIVGINVVKLPSGALAAIVTTSDNQQLTIPPSFSPTIFQGVRSLWREIEVYR